MYNTINPNILRKAGDYLLSDVTLISYQSTEGSSRPKKISIRAPLLYMTRTQCHHHKYLLSIMTQTTLFPFSNVLSHLIVKRTHLTKQKRPKRRLVTTIPISTPRAS